MNSNILLWLLSFTIHSNKVYTHQNEREELTCILKLMEGYMYVVLFEKNYDDENDGREISKS